MLPWQQGPDSSILNYTADMPIYCSPELFRSYARNSGTDAGFDKYKSDVFSIGLIVCYAGLLKPVQHIYDRNTNTVRVDSVTKLVEEFVSLYYAHRELCSIVSSCLNVRAELRPDFSKLKADFFSFATIADVPQYDVTSKFKPFGINEGPGQSMTALQFVPGQSGVNVAQPLGHSKGHAFEGVSYIDPTQVEQNQENYESNVGPSNRFSHPDPTGFMNTSLWNWNAPRNTDPHHSEVNVGAGPRDSFNQQNNRLSIGRIAKTSHSDMMGHHAEKDKIFHSKVGETDKSRLYQRIGGGSILDAQSMEYHYVKHHQLNGMGQPVLHFDESKNLKINLGSGPVLVDNYTNDRSGHDSQWARSSRVIIDEKGDNRMSHVTQGGSSPNIFSNKGANFDQLNVPNLGEREVHQDFTKSLFPQHVEPQQIQSNVRYSQAAPTYQPAQNNVRYLQAAPTYQPAQNNVRYSSGQPRQSNVSFTGSPSGDRKVTTNYGPEVSYERRGESRVISSGVVQGQGQGQGGSQSYVGRQY
jgi:hypothetical protein